jgi:hypothetical protein
VNSVGPFPLAPVLARLRALVPSLRTVGSCADLRTAVDQQPPATPAAYVVRQERAKRSSGASGGVLIQEMGVDLIVVLYVRNQAGAATGEGAASEMDALVASVRGALLNWAPAAGFDPLSHNASRDESYRAGLLCTQELLSSRYRLEVRP